MRVIPRYFWVAISLLAMLMSAGCFQSASTGQPTLPPPAPATTAPQGVSPTSPPVSPPTSPPVSAPTSQPGPVFVPPTSTLVAQQVLATATPSPMVFQPPVVTTPTSGVIAPPFPGATSAAPSPIPGWPTQPPAGGPTPTPTFNPFAAATATIISATVTEAARLGTIYPTETPGPGTGTPAPGATPTTGSCTYVVQPGQNLFRIGLEVGVPYQQLAAANGIVNPDRIVAGQVLVIPGCSQGGSTGGTGQRTYVVRRGDNLFRIALNHGVSVQELAAANGITNPRLIYEGQVLIIPE